MSAEKPRHDFKRIASGFDLYGSFQSAAPYGSGHINDTFELIYDQAGRPVRYILQRVNENVFKEGEALMENIRRVTAHQRAKLAEADADEPSRRALTLVPAVDGRCFHRDGNGNLWRVYLFIERATGHDRIETPAQAEAAARAFGEFQLLLVDLPGGPLHETIPKFHDTASRFKTLLAAVEADACNRAAGVKAEIDFALAREADADRLLALQRAGELPTVVTHNDTKLNNVLLDDATGEGVCVIDLDTVMPGLALYDFGDMVRTATNSAPEDEPDVSKVYMRMPMFEALVRGYLSSAGGFLNATELALLPFSGKLLTFECAIRFLTDYLQGDVYFKTRRPGQNLDRCRSHFKLVASIEESHDAMLEVVRRAAAK
ncbi:MAG: phosphotransferase enzyme family protein [Kiritimatiellia bacterium]|jgi:Ser/Thr protein kinase RdoA (MazF antagonist)